MAPKTLHDALTPLVYFNCFVGLGAYRQSNQSRTAYFIMELYTLIIISIHWAAIYLTLSSITEALNFAAASPMAYTMYKALVYTNSCNTVIGPLLVWLRSKETKDCVRQMLVLDATFQTVLRVPNEYRKQYISLICKLVGIILAVLLMVIHSSVMLSSTLQKNGPSPLLFWCSLEALHDPILVMFALDMNFCTSVGYLSGKFRDINDCLLGLTENPPAYCPGERLFVVSLSVGKMTRKNVAGNTKAGSLMNDKHHSLQEIRKAHLQLCKLSRKINHAFGVQNLLSTAISFVMVTGLLYTIYSGFSGKDFSSVDPNEVVSSAVWVFIYAFRIWIVNHSCSSVCNEAERTGEVIYEFLNSKVNKGLEKEVNEFGVQMLQNPVRFDACGFFTLNYSFVQGVIGSITTYLVILIQMSPVSKSHTTNASVTGNGTEISENH